MYLNARESISLESNQRGEKNLPLLLMPTVPGDKIGRSVGIWGQNTGHDTESAVILFLTPNNGNGEERITKLFLFIGLQGGEPSHSDNLI